MTRRPGQDIGGMDAERRPVHAGTREAEAEGHGIRPEKASDNAGDRQRHDIFRG